MKKQTKEQKNSKTMLKVIYLRSFHSYSLLVYSQKLSGIFHGSGPRSAIDCTGSHCP